MKKQTVAKIVALLTFSCIAINFSACNKDNIDNSTNSSYEQTDGNDSSSSTTKIKLLGDIIPAPTMKYDIINGSDESVYLEVENVTESDFRAYVETCKPYGFDGYIKSATSPDLYYMEYNSENYYLEVFFYEENQKFSVYVRTPKN